MSGVLFIIVRTLDMGKFKSFDFGVFDLSLFGSLSVLVLESKIKKNNICKFKV